MSSSSQRLIWIDISKTFAIILVVFGHVWRGLDEGELLKSHLFNSVDTAIYLFHMPLFFMISGFLFFKSYQKNWRSLLKRQLTYIVWPYILWSVIIVSIKVFMSSSVNSETSFAILPKIIYEPVAVFWFLYVLFVAQIFVKIFFENIKSIWFLLLFSLLLMGISYIFNLTNIMVLDLIAKFLIFFILGFVLAKVDFLNDVQANKFYAVLALVLFCGVEAISLWIGIELDSLFSPLVGAILSLCIIVVCLYLSHINIFRSLFFVYVSMGTLAIYVSHVIFTAGTRILLVKLDITDVTTHVILGTVLGVTIPLIVYEVSKRIKLSVLAGLGPAPATK